MTEAEIKAGWEQARTYPDEKPPGTYTVAVRERGKSKQILLTDGEGNWYFTTDYMLRLDQEMKKKRWQ